MQGKRILLGVTGGIAAYKSPDLVRRLREQGAEVQVVLTAGAREFVTPMTFQAVSGREVRSDLWDPEAEKAMSHIELARWADFVIIAPATADFLARLATGQADDLLTTLCLATDAPIALAPAMNRLMWSNAATQANVATLKARGIHVWGPGEGDQACGEVGAGRMLEPTQLAAFVSNTHRSLGPAGGQARAADRRADARAHRPGTLHQQSQLGKDGVCGRGRRARGGRRRHHRLRTGESCDAAGCETHRRGERRRHAQRRHEEHRRRRYLHRHGRGRRLPAGQPGRMQDQEDQRIHGSARWNAPSTSSRRWRRAAAPRVRSWWASRPRPIPWNNTRVRNSSRRIST